jgi:hypothetical protein
MRVIDLSQESNSYFSAPAAIQQEQHKDGQPEDRRKAMKRCQSAYSAPAKP